MKESKLNPWVITLIVLLFTGLCAGVASAQTTVSFEGDKGAKALVNKALKYYGSAKIQGDKVVFKKDRYVGFIVKDESPKQAMELVTCRATEESELIRRSRVKLRWDVNPETQCRLWHKGEVFSSYYKGKYYALLVCKI